jgi:hypothetical protein
VLRFIDLTDTYWPLTLEEDKAMRADDDPSVYPVCAFLDTTTNKFVCDKTGCQVFFDTSEFEECREAERMLALVPEGFFGRHLANY